VVSGIIRSRDVTVLRDLMIAARNGWVIAFDNISHLTPAMSDALCRLATSGGFATRQLYADAEETLIDATRPIILNGIEEPATRGDLLDRGILVSLPRIDGSKRMEESRLWTRFAELHPYILGALLDAAVHALTHADELELHDLPRMADAAKWVAAAEPALVWPERWGGYGGNFLAAYQANREEAQGAALEASPVAMTIFRFMSDRQTWSGTASDLLEALKGESGEAAWYSNKANPRWPRGMSAALVRLTPGLRACGLFVTMGNRSSSKERHRLITISKHELAQDGHVSRTDDPGDHERPAPWEDDRRTVGEQEEGDRPRPSDELPF
jgi:hypothetical protein